MFSFGLLIRCCQTTTLPTPFNMLSRRGLAYKTKHSQVLVALLALEFELAAGESSSPIPHGQHHKLPIS
jgi:hypothetical protein